MATVAIVGAGIIGVTTALAILEKDPKIKVTVFADNFTPNTTSNGAAGLIMPFTLVDTPKHLQRKWFDFTMKKLEALLKTDQAPKLGIFLVSGYNVSDEHFEEHFWKDSVYSYRKMSEKELADFPIQPARCGVSFSTIVSEGSYLLPWLMDKVRKLGGSFVKRHISSLNELCDYDVVVNCSGINAKQLVIGGDPELKAYRGQVLKIKAPWIKHLYLYDSKKELDKGLCTYIIPQMESIVVGGSKQLNNYNTNPTAEDTAGIIERTSRIVPSIKNATVLQNWAGLRPARSVRLEKETMRYVDKQGWQRTLNVVHNYGHGGGGLSIGFGCAEDCCQLVMEVIADKRKSKL